MLQPQFRLATPADVDRCYEIESAAYPADEAATREKIAIRIGLYPQGFLCMELQGEIIGFINCGCAWDVVMSDEEFKALVGHDPEAPNVVIMSVVLHPDWQGKGYATPLMREFVMMMRNMGKKTINLMCKEEYLGLYKKLGYRYTGPSASTHGGEAWFEMIMAL